MHMYNMYAVGARVMHIPDDRYYAYTVTSSKFPVQSYHKDPIP